MITNPFFRPDFVIDKNFFDEGPAVTPPRAVAVNSSSIDTSAIDKYRQGVEITHIKHYDAGIVKIHAGEPGHKWCDRRYGLGKKFRADYNAFEETKTFDAVGYIRDQANGDITTYTYPIVTKDYDASENYDKDGTIEPLTIRSKASFYSVDVPFEAHDIKAGLMGGNFDSVLSSDQVVTVDYFVPNPRPVPFIDMIDMIGNMPMQGYFDLTQAKLLPFVEERIANGFPLKSTYPSDMKTALAKMNLITTASITGTLGTDSYVRYNQIAQTSGWIFEGSIDSLAFGGFEQ